MKRKSAIKSLYWNIEELSSFFVPDSEEYDSEWEDEMQEAFTCIKVSVGQEKAPNFAEVFECVPDAIEITPDELKKKERM